MLQDAGWVCSAVLHWTWDVKAGLLVIPLTGEMLEPEPGVEGTREWDQEERGRQGPRSRVGPYWRGEE